jgi:hypothetical protein
MDEDELKEILMDLAEGIHRLASIIELIVEREDDDKEDS